MNVARLIHSMKKNARMTNEERTKLKIKTLKEQNPCKTKPMPKSLICRILWMVSHKK